MGHPPARQLRAGLVLASVIAAAATAVAGPAAASPKTTDWSAYLDGPSHTSYNASAVSITPAALADLQPVWQFQAPASPNSGSVGDLASPVVVDGVVYVGLADGQMYAVSEATQSVLWSRSLGFIKPTTCGSSAGIASTATVAKDPETGQRVVFVNAPDGYLYALSAATGATVWRSVVGIPSTTENNYYAWGSPTVASGKVYIGISSRCDNPLVPAGVLAFSQHSGKRLAYWDSLPKGRIGGSVWSSIGVLPDGNVVATTGNSKGKTQIPYAEAVAELSGRTLKLLSYWMIPAAQQVTDSDFGGSPTVFTGRPGGVTTTMVGACNKNGMYYAFRADDIAAGPVWETRIGAPSGAGVAECDAAAIWNGHYLIEGGGSPVTIGKVTYEGSVQELNPTTGKVIWRTGLPGYIIGSAAEDGAGVVAAPTYSAPATEEGVYLLSASTGKVLKYLSTAPASDFAQPVFDRDNLLVGAIGGLPVTAYAVTKPGQSTPVTVSPATLQPGQTVTLTVTGTGHFTAPARVIVSGTAVRVESVQVTSSTTAVVKVTVAKTVPAGSALNLTLAEPDLTAFWCTSCLGVG